MIYTKKFITHADYNVYINSQNKILPNVSYCEDDNDVHYNPWVDPVRIVAKFNITDTSSATEICYSSNTSDFTEIEIDGVVQPSVVSSYTFDTTGEHTIKYTLANPTQIRSNVFYQCSSLTSVTIPNSVTTIVYNAFGRCSGLTNITIPNSVISIGVGAFNSCIGLTSITIPDSVTTIDSDAFINCTNLTSVTIGNSVTSIADYAFSDCTSLTSVTLEATTPPTLDDSAFNSNASGRKIYVPSVSVDTYKAASGWSTYANDIQAIS